MIYLYERDTNLLFVGAVFVFIRHYQSDVARNFCKSLFAQIMRLEESKKKTCVPYDVIDTLVQLEAVQTCFHYCVRRREVKIASL